MQKKIELLAPAGTALIGRAAILAGADAVYIGAERFSARDKAVNSMQDIEELARFAHLYKARVYLALNTVLHERELDEALSSIRRAWNAGVDALIIQDMGLLELDLPPLPLHASTQCHNDSPEKAEFLSKAGFSRAILARELTLDEITAIGYAADPMEIEAFVHGSLCVSYSGRCHLSLALGGRSANRGDCAQPCRLPWRVADENNSTIIDESHLLSLRDLNLSHRLEDLLDAGVTSLKIEGRLKDAEYVRNVTAHYRTKLDDLFAKESRFIPASSGKSIAGFTPALEKTFQRGYTSFFLDERVADQAAVETPKFRGEKIGLAAEITRDGFILAPGSLTLVAGDRICWMEHGETEGTTVFTAESRKIVTRKPVRFDKGTEIWRNHDKNFMQELESAEDTRTISMKFHLKNTGSELTLSAEDEDRHSASASYKEVFETARDAAMAKERLSLQIAKTGGTLFSCSLVTFEGEMPFIPVSKVNELRRQVLAGLTEDRAANYRREEVKISATSHAWPEAEVDFRTNIINPKAEAFYKRHGANVTELGAEAGMDLHGREVMALRYCPLFEHELCLKKTPPAKPLPWYLVDSENRRLRMDFDCKACRLNLVFD